MYDPALVAMFQIPSFQTSSHASHVEFRFNRRLSLAHHAFIAETYRVSWQGGTVLHVHPDHSVSLEQWLVKNAHYSKVESYYAWGMSRR